MTSVGHLLRFAKIKSLTVCCKNKVYVTSFLNGNTSSVGSVALKILMLQGFNFQKIFFKVTLLNRFSLDILLKELSLFSNSQIKGISPISMKIRVHRK